MMQTQPLITEDKNDGHDQLAIRMCPTVGVILVMVGTVVLLLAGETTAVVVALFPSKSYDPMLMKGVAPHTVRQQGVPLVKAQNLPVDDTREMLHTTVQPTPSEAEQVIEEDPKSHFSMFGGVIAAILSALSAASLYMMTAKRAATAQSPQLDRRQALASMALAVGVPMTVSQPAQSIVGGVDVSVGEAASVGAVGLYIDLAGCTICRKDVPATCSGTLVAPNLVLSAKHCVDISAELNGKLEKIVFAPNMLDPNAPSREVDRVVSTTDYGIDLQGNDLVLIRFKGTAPEPWKPVELPLRLLPRQNELDEASRISQLTTIGTPKMATYGYGETKWDTQPQDYTSGKLKRILIQVVSEVRPWAPGFLTAPLDPESGTCAGDSGGAALMGLIGPNGTQPRTLLMGVQAAAELPCKGNRAIYIYPDTFSEFLEKASADLGSPIKPSLSWRDYKKP